MPKQDFTSYSINVSTSELADIVGRLEKSALGVPRDTIITGALVLAIGKSDPATLKDETKFRNTLDSLSQHLCWLISLPQELPKGTVTH